MFPLVEVRQISEEGTRPNGDSTLIRFFDHFKKNSILIDCGTRNNVVKEYLDGIGVRELDLVVASHIDKDHIGGLKNVLDGFDVKELWIMNINPFKQFIETSVGFESEKAHFLKCFVAAHESIRTAKGKMVRCVSVHEGDITSIGPFLLEVLWPPYTFEDFLRNPANVESILKTEKGRTYKKFLERLRAKGDLDQGVETEVNEPREIDLERLNWVVERGKDFKSYPEEDFLYNFNLASRGLLNNVSIVLRISCFSPPCLLGSIPGALTMLFPGDLEDWDYLYSKYFRSIDAHVLKTPHHGDANIMIGGNSLYSFLNPYLSLLFPFPQHDLPSSIVRNQLISKGIVSCTSCKGPPQVRANTQCCFHANNCTSSGTAIYEFSPYGTRIQDGRNVCAGLMRSKP